MQTASPTRRLARWRTLENWSLLTRSEKVVWLLFAATSFQLAFLQPYIILLPGQGTNLFSGLLCFLTLVVALIFAGRGAIKFSSPEFLVSAALTVLGIASSLSSINPLSAFYRVFVLLASALGGFWCAKILLSTPENQRRFQWLCLFLLGGVVLLSLEGFCLSREIHHYFFNGSNHPLTNLIILLSFAPLALLGQKSRPLVLLGIILLTLSYATLCLSQRLSMVFIPLGLGFLGLLMGLRWKHLVLALVLCAVVIGLFVHQIYWFKVNKTYPYYRIENFFFSGTIAKQHPLLGIGLKTPRKNFLKDYQIKYPYTDKKQFSKDIASIISADNIFLTFMAGLGFPFLICYLTAISVLLYKLVRMTLRPPPNYIFHPLVLLFPIMAALVHYQFYDGLLFAQNCWFFHILLGLIPSRAGTKAEQI